MRRQGKQRLAAACGGRLAAMHRNAAPCSAFAGRALAWGIVLANVCHPPAYRRLNYPRKADGLRGLRLCRALASRLQRSRANFRGYAFEWAVAAHRRSLPGRSACHH